MNTAAKLEEFVPEIQPVPASEGQPGDDEIEWTKGMSKNGTPFEYGVLKADILNADDPAAFARHQGEWNALILPVSSSELRADGPRPAPRKVLTLAMACPGARS